MSKELQHKLYHFEVEPPAQLWSEIVSTLDSEKTNHFSERLYHFEAAPPKHIWQQIESELENSNSPVVPIRSRITKLYRYGSAAAVLIITALLLNLLLNKESISDKDTSKASFEKQIPLSNSSIENPSSKTKEKGTDTEDNDLAFLRPSRPKSIIAKNIPPVVSKPATRSLTRHDRIIMPNNVPLVKTEVLDRYIVLPKTSGEVIRLSKKLYALFACSDINPEDCKQNIQAMQQKIASPAVIASTDFSGMLDLLQTVNKQ